MHARTRTHTHTHTKIIIHYIIGTLQIHLRVGCLRFSISVSIVDNGIKCLIKELHDDYLWCGPNVDTPMQHIYL